jgi:hypothetical protein
MAYIKFPDDLLELENIERSKRHIRVPSGREARGDPREARDSLQDRPLKEH